MTRSAIAFFVFSFMFPSFCLPLHSIGFPFNSFCFFFASFFCSFSFFSLLFPLPFHPPPSLSSPPPRLSPHLLSEGPSFTKALVALSSYLEQKRMELRLSDRLVQAENNPTELASYGHATGAADETDIGPLKQIDWSETTVRPF